MLGAATRPLAVTFLCCALSVPLILVGGGVPNTFVDGSVAVASEVNDNFANLAGRLDVIDGVPPTVMALAGSFSADNGVPTKIPWSVVVHDPDGNFDTINNEYIVPETGNYRITSGVNANPGSNVVNEHRVHYNTVLRRVQYTHTSHGNVVTAALNTVVFDAQAGAKLSFYYQQNSGSTQSALGGSNEAQNVLIITKVP